MKCEKCGENWTFMAEAQSCCNPAGSEPTKPTGFMTRIDALGEAIDALHWHADSGNDRAEEALGIVSKMRISLIKANKK